MMQKAWSSIEEVSYCFSRSSVKFQGHMAQRIFDFDSTWAFPDCNSSLNSLMDLKWCTKLDVEEKTCPIIFRGHPSNSNVTYARLIPYCLKSVLFYLGFCYQAHQLIGILGNTVFIMRRGPVGPLHYTGDSQSSWNIHHHRGEQVMAFQLVPLHRHDGPQHSVYLIYLRKMYAFRLKFLLVFIGFHLTIFQHRFR